MDLCEGIYDVTSFALNRAYKDVVKPLADIYNKASDIMDKIPTPVKIAAGLIGGAIAIGTGIAPAIVAGTMIKAAVSGAVISGAMYGVSSLFTGNFDKKEFVNSMLHGATDMFMISGVTLGVKGVVDCVTRNSGRIREAMLANEEGGTNAVDKLDEFYESRVRGGSGKYYNADGSPIWPPNRGFDGEPVTTTLEPGTMVDRYGYDGGYFVSPEGTSYTERALPVGTDKKPYTVFEVIKPVKVQSGKIAPWFGEKGGGIQYEFSNKISELLEQGILRKVEH